MPKLVGDRFVSREKIENYLLNYDHPKGASKARYFASFGFTRMQWHALLTALSHHPALNEVVGTETSDHGMKSMIQCSILTPDGRNPCIMTVWILLHGDSVHRFVTAYRTSRAY